jgi:eukaryotic-like serine/threonine-protein kinase
MDGRVLAREPGDPRRLGPYELVGRLGQGGMGVVYLGRERRGGRLAAVKALRPELAGDPAFAARFRREVEAARRVDSPRVARVLGAEPAGPRPWLATEFVDGPTLAAAVAAGGPLAGGRLTGFAAGVAEALAAIHAAGIVHRDLKPGNVLLEDPGAGGPGGQGVKVIDFGIAWAADATMTRSGVRLGTPAWIAPERLRDLPAGPAADVFAWGALVAFAATGRHPFGGGPPEAVAYRILHDPPDLTGVPTSLRPLVQAALARDPAARPTASRLAATLAAVLAPTVPLAATGPTRVLPAAAARDDTPLPPTRRHRRRRVGGLLAAVVLLVGLLAAPQVVVAASGDGDPDPAEPALAKRCLDQGEDEDDRATAAGDAGDRDAEEAAERRQEAAEEDREDRAEHKHEAACAPQAGCQHQPGGSGRAAPSTAPAAPATATTPTAPATRTPMPPDPAPGPVLGS